MEGSFGTYSENRVEVQFWKVDKLGALCGLIHVGTPCGPMKVDK